MQRLWVVDQNTRSDVGHYLNYTSCVCEAGMTCGLDVVLLSHIEAKDRFADTYDAIPTFRRDWAESENGQPLPWLPGNFAFDLSQSLGRLPVSGNDQILIHTIGSVQLEELMAWFIDSTPKQTTPHYHIVLRFDPGDQPRFEALSSYFCEAFASQQLRRHIHFWADTKPLAREYQKLTGVSFETVPIPVRQLSSDNSDGRAGSVGNGPLKAAYLGDARIEKGYLCLPGAAVWLRQRYLASNRLLLMIQSNLNIPGGEPGIVKARNELAAIAPGVILFGDPLPVPRYTELLINADIILLPYSPARYRLRSSGVLIEALAAGKVIVTSSGSWLASQLLPEQAVLFDEPDQLGPAIGEAVESFERLSRGARGAREHWQNWSRGENLLRSLVRSAGASPNLLSQRQRISSFSVQKTATDEVVQALLDGQPLPRAALQELATRLPKHLVQIITDAITTKSVKRKVTPLAETASPAIRDELLQILQFLFRELGMSRDPSWLGAFIHRVLGADIGRLRRRKMSQGIEALLASSLAVGVAAFAPVVPASDWALDENGCPLLTRRTDKGAYAIVHSLLTPSRSGHGRLRRVVLSLRANSLRVEPACLVLVQHVPIRPAVSVLGHRVFERGWRFGAELRGVTLGRNEIGSLQLPLLTTRFAARWVELLFDRVDVAAEPPIVRIAGESASLLPDGVSTNACRFRLPNCIKSEAIGLIHVIVENQQDEPLRLIRIGVIAIRGELPNELVATSLDLWDRVEDALWADEPTPSPATRSLLPGWVPPPEPLAAAPPPFEILSGLGLVPPTDDAIPHIMAGDRARDGRDWRAASVSYHCALEADPTLTGIWVQFGHMLKEQGDHAGAEMAYRRSLRLDPEVADTHLHLGYVLKLQRRLIEATASFFAALSRDRALNDARRELRALGFLPEETAAVLEVGGLPVPSRLAQSFENKDLRRLTLLPKEQAILLVR